MKYIIALSLPIIILFQLSLLEGFKYLHFIPNLILVFFVFLAVYMDLKNSVIYAFIIGLTLDTLSINTFGIYSAFYILMAIIIDFIKKYIGTAKSFSLVLISTALSSLLLIVIESLIISSLKGSNIGVIMPIISSLFLRVVSSTMTVFIFYPIFN